jgi:hypothetical protein
MSLSRAQLYCPLTFCGLPAYTAIIESMLGSNIVGLPQHPYRIQCPIPSSEYFDLTGFGIGADRVWNVFGAIGYRIGERSSIELGYRHMHVEYSDRDFDFDRTTGGLFLGIGFQF